MHFIVKVMEILSLHTLEVQFQLTKSPRGLVSQAEHRSPCEVVGEKN